MCPDGYVIKHSVGNYPSQFDYVKTIHILYEKQLWMIVPGAILAVFKVEFSLSLLDCLK